MVNHISSLTHRQTLCYHYRDRRRYRRRHRRRRRCRCSAVCHGSHSPRSDGQHRMNILSSVFVHMLDHFRHLKLPDLCRSRELAVGMAFETMSSRPLPHHINHPAQLMMTGARACEGAVGDRVLGMSTSIVTCQFCLPCSTPPPPSNSKHETCRPTAARPPIGPLLLVAALCNRSPHDYPRFVL